MILGTSAGLPIIHLIFFPESIKGFKVAPDISFWVYGGISYFAGAFLYIFIFAEKYFKKEFGEMKDNIINKSESVLNYIHKNVRTMTISILL